MPESSFRLAGWMAIINAAIFPLAFVLNIAFAVFTAKLLGFYQPTFGPGDVLSLISFIIAIYILVRFRALLHEHYEFYEVDGLITAAIVWTIAFEAGGIMLRFIQMAMGRGRDEEIFTAILSMSYLAVCVAIAGVIDILIAVKLMKIKEQVNDVMRFYIYLTLITGILEVSIIFSPISLLLVPVSFITMGIIFFRDKDQVQFV